ncbi:MAG: phosphatase PAP2 family protein [Hydrogenophaga sp.]|uniref:phosphatase PAP2 family protein n=1 Tax=Hydrogenophaga sp. TaxID=1904254 RepID=UPI001D9423FE|nr:phosphatase PAP2 family protein [Hydrogenophaga sp.]MBX3609938.1 phosphatase PAP2 family protein [Hydrogenophaga sp.]
MHDPTTGWSRQLAQRFATLWYLKAVGTAAFMVLFFQAYFWVLKHPGGTPTVVPALALDHWIPVTPVALYAYGWLWVFVSLPPAFIGDFRSLLRYGAWVALMCALSLGIFWLWPTQTPHFDVDWSAHPQLAFLKGIDAAGNACPSLHVAAAVHATFWLLGQMRTVGAPVWTRWAIVAQCLAIVWSTLAIRQHVAIDAVCGAAVGLLFAWLSMRHRDHRF